MGVPAPTVGHHLRLASAADPALREAHEAAAKAKPARITAQSVARMQELVTLLQQTGVTQDVRAARTAMDHAARSCGQIIPSQSASRVRYVKSHPLFIANYPGLAEWLVRFRQLVHESPNSLSIYKNCEIWTILEELPTRIRRDPAGHLSVNLVIPAGSVGSLGRFP